MKDIEHLDQNRLFMIDFGAGLPGAPVPLKDIPSGSTVVSGPWAPDSSAVFVQNYATPSETYLVHLSAKGNTTQLLFSEPEDTFNLDFCADPRWFVRTVSDKSWRVDSQHPADEQPLWDGWTESSPDRHWVLNSNDDTGLWVASCEPGSKPTKFSDTPAPGGFDWSSDAHFMAVSHDDVEIEVFDTTQKYKSVFTSPAVDYRWAPQASHLAWLGAANTKGVQAISELDLSTIPPKVTKRGTTPTPSSWGFVKDDTLWAARFEPGSLYGFWLLEPGTTTWRRIATKLSDVTPYFSPDRKFVVLTNQLIDGTKQVLAFSLQGTAPMAMPIFPTPLSGSVGPEFFYEGGLILSRFVDVAEPFEGQLWWAAGSATGFGTPTPLVDVRAGTSPHLQPQP